MGKFIVVEGLDGVGKTTFAKELAVHLGGVYTREPGGTPAAELLRNVIKDDAVGIENNQDAEILMVFAARIYHAQHIRRLLDAGTTVVCDRWIHSTVLYQGTTEERIDTIHDLTEQFLSDVKPDVALLLSTDHGATDEQLHQRGAFDHLDKRSKLLASEIDWDDTYWHRFADRTLHIKRDQLSDSIMDQALTFVNQSNALM